MVVNQFAEGLHPRRRLPEQPVEPVEPVSGQDGGQPVRRHKFSALVSDEDYALLRRVNYETGVGYPNLLHAMLDYCIREHRLDLDAVPKRVDVNG